MCLLLLKASQYFAEWAVEHVDMLERRYVCQVKCLLCPIYMCLQNKFVNKILELLQKQVMNEFAYAFMAVLF